MEGRAALARRLIETRVGVADDVLERLGPRSSGQASPLIVRSLVSALGQSLDAAGPEPLVSWARMAHGAYALPIIHDLVAPAATSRRARASGSTSTSRRSSSSSKSSRRT